MEAARRALAAGRRPLPLVLYGFDASNQSPVAPQFARRIQPLGLRLHAQPEQRFGRFLERQRELLVAHFS